LRKTIFMLANTPAQSPTSKQAVPLRNTAKGRWPYWHWVLLVVAPLLATLALALQSQHMRTAAQQLTQETEQLQTRTALVIKNAALNADMQGTPQSFKEEFPGYDQRLERVAAFLERLAQLGTPAPPTSYRQSTLGESGLEAYHVSLSTTTSYSAWRDFMDDVLWADPALALTSLSLVRSDSQTAQVRVQAVFTFYMQAPVTSGSSESIASSASGASSATVAANPQSGPQAMQTGSAP
jgi:hypothetical protein